MTNKQSLDFALWLSNRIWGYARPCMNCPLRNECGKNVSQTSCTATLYEHITKDGEQE